MPCKPAVPFPIPTEPARMITSPGVCGPKYQTLRPTIFDFLLVLRSKYDPDVDSYPCPNAGLNSHICYTATPASSCIILHRPASTVNLLAFTGCCAFQNFDQFPQYRLQWPPRQLLGAWLWQLLTVQFFQSHTNSTPMAHGRPVSCLQSKESIARTQVNDSKRPWLLAQSSESSESSVLSKLSDLVV